MDLHGQIMNIRCDEFASIALNNRKPTLHYAAGHRDARHAAAELALKADALAEAVDKLLKLADSDNSTEWNVALCRLRDAKAAYVSG